MNNLEVSEEEFLRSMRANNEEQLAEGYNMAENNSHDIIVGDESAQQIESSDEYDPAQDVPDMMVSSSLGQQAQISSFDSPADTTATASRPNSSTAVVDDSTAPAASSTSAFPAPSNTSDKLTAQPPPAPTIAAASIPAMSAKPLPAAQKARLPNDLVGILEDRIKLDPKGDVDAWLGLIKEFERQGKLEDARKAYQRFLEAFPLAGEQWAAFIRFETEADNRQGVQTLLNEALYKKGVSTLELWTAYLDYVRRYFNVLTDETGKASQVIHSAYKSAVDATGIDKDAGKLWQDYIDFIKSGPGTIGQQDWQSQRKMDLLREAYQEAISVPTQAVETLWKDYSAFENGLNKMTGRQLLQKNSADYMSARSSYTELQNITRELVRTTLPKLPPALGFDGDIEFMKQVDIWQRWIQWEKDDPLVLKEENNAAYKKRIIYVYKQALMALTFWPELWFDAAEFCFANDMVTEGDDFLAQGSTYNPESSLLAFRRADRFEMTTTNGSDDRSKIQRGEKVCGPYNDLLDALYALVEKAADREKQEIARIEAEFAESALQEEEDAAAKSDSDDDDDNDDKETRGKKAVEDKKQSQINALKAISSIQITLLTKSISHAWIAMMQALQRMQGKGNTQAKKKSQSKDKADDKEKLEIGGSRQVLAKAYKRGHITSEVWLAAALLEFHTSDIEAAKRVFARGWKVFLEDENFAVEYIKFLTNINDHTNARVVFEQTVSKLTSKPETTSKAKVLFIFFHKYECMYGELAGIQKLEARMKELFPDDPKIYAFSQRFTTGNFDPTAIRPIISPAAQTRPKALVAPPLPIIPSFEQPPSRQPSPPRNVMIPPLPIVNSPKRPLEDSFDNDASRPRKIVRGESPNPLAGAAGRRLGAIRQGVLTMPAPLPNGAPPSLPPPLPRDITFLLSIIPPASTYDSVLFNPEAMVNLIRDTNIPSTVEQLPINQRTGAPGVPGAYYR